METHNVVSPDEWTKARVAFLAKEKELTHRRDALAAERRELPWMKMPRALHTSASGVRLT